jgi:hypothetical protein
MKIDRWNECTWSEKEITPENQNVQTTVLLKHKKDREEHCLYKKKQLNFNVVLLFLNNSTNKLPIFNIQKVLHFSFTSEDRNCKTKKA